MEHLKNIYIIINMAIIGSIYITTALAFMSAEGRQYDSYWYIVVWMVAFLAY